MLRVYCMMTVLLHHRCFNKALTVAAVSQLSDLPSCHFGLLSCGVLVFGPQLWDEPRQALCQFAVSFGIMSDHDVVNISHILHFLPFCLALPFKRLLLIFYIQLKAGRMMKMRLTGTEDNILNTSSDPDHYRRLENVNLILDFIQLFNLFGLTYVG